MRLLYILPLLVSFVFSENVCANETFTQNHDIVSKEIFLTYNNVADFIDDSPKVTIVVKALPQDVAEYGKTVVKSLTGTDCDRDGKMDDNATCNAVYYKLWLKYKR